MLPIQFLKEVAAALIPGRDMIDLQQELSPEVQQKIAESRAKAQAKADRKKYLKEQLEAIRVGWNIHYVDVHPEKSDESGLLPEVRGMTIAYRVARRNVIHVSTALLHPNDRFDKYEGRLLAAERLTNGQSIEVYVPSYALKNIPHFLRCMFS
jgi:hypothetical protein